MLSEDWNVKWNTVGISHGLGLCARMCVCVCIFMHSGTRQVCFCGQNNPCYCPAILLLLPHARPIRQKGTTTNKSKSWHQICDHNKVWKKMVKKKNKKRKQQHKEQQCIFGGRSYFSRHVSVIIIPGVAHVWSQQAVEQHSLLPVHRVGRARRDGESRRRARARDEEDENDRRRSGWRRERKKGRGSERARWELCDLDPNSVWLVFISTSRCCAISQFSLSRPWSVCGTVFMSREGSAGDKSRGGEAVRRSEGEPLLERHRFLSLPLLEPHIISNPDPIVLLAASLFGPKSFRNMGWLFSHFFYFFYNPLWRYLGI